VQKLLYITSRPHDHPIASERDGVTDALTSQFATDRLVLTPVAESCATDASNFGSNYLHTFALRAARNWRGQYQVHGAARDTLRRTLLEGDYDIIFFDGEDMLDLASGCARFLLTAKVTLRSDRFRLRTNLRHFLRVPTRLSPQEVLDNIEKFQPPRLKLALVTNRFWPEVGGAETNIWFQARELARQHDVTVFCPRRLAESPGRETTDEGIRIRRLWDMRNPRKRFPNRAINTLCPGLFFHLLFARFHIVQCFPALNHNNILALVASRLRRRPCLLVSFDFIDYSRLMQDSGKTTGLLDDYELPGWRAFFLRRFAHIFTISDRETEFIRHYNPNAEYSPVPVEISEYETEPNDYRAKYGVGKDEFVYLMLGRVAHTKGQDLGVRAFAKIAGQLPDAHLVIVGRSDYEPEFLAEIESVIRKNDIEDRVTFTGMVEREEVLGWLRHSDVHVVPVRFMNSGAVVVESWISGTPVVQSDIVDPNLVREGINGFLHRSEDVDDLAAALVRAHAAREKLTDLATVGARLVRRRYTYQALVELYGHRYRDVLSQREHIIASERRHLPATSADANGTAEKNLGPQHTLRPKPLVPIPAASEAANSQEPHHADH
jgi:glycosyltransferase involved in cell wall biosynthesis